MSNLQPPIPRFESYWTRLYLSLNPDRQTAPTPASPFTCFNKCNVFSHRQNSYLIILKHFGSSPDEHFKSESHAPCSLTNDWKHEVSKVMQIWHCFKSVFFWFWFLAFGFFFLLFFLHCVVLSMSSVFGAQLIKQV